MWFTGSKKGETEKSYGGCTQGWRFQCDFNVTSVQEA